MSKQIVEQLVGTLLIARILYLSGSISWQLTHKVLGRQYDNISHQLCLLTRKGFSAIRQEITHFLDSEVMNPSASNSKEGVSDVKNALISSALCPKCRGKCLLQPTNLQLREDPHPGSPVSRSLATRPVVALECIMCGYCELYTTELPHAAP